MTSTQTTGGIARAKLKAHLEKVWGYRVVSEDSLGPLVVKTGWDGGSTWERREGVKGDWVFEKVESKRVL